MATRSILRDPATLNSHSAPLKRVTFADLLAKSLSEHTSISFDSSDSTHTTSKLMSSSDSLFSIELHPRKSLPFISRSHIQPIGSPINNPRDFKDVKDKPVVNRFQKDKTQKNKLKFVHHSNVSLQQTAIPNAQLREQPKAMKDAKIPSKNKSQQIQNQSILCQCPRCIALVKTDQSSPHASKFTPKKITEAPQTSGVPFTRRRSDRVVQEGNYGRGRDIRPPVAESRVVKRRTSRAARMALIQAASSKQQHRHHVRSSQDSQNSSKRAARRRYRRNARRSSSQLSDNAAAAKGRNEVNATPRRYKTNGRKKSVLGNSKQDKGHGDGDGRPVRGRQRTRSRGAPGDTKSISDSQELDKAWQQDSRKLGRKNSGTNGEGKTGAVRKVNVTEGLELKSAREYIGMCLDLSASDGVLTALDGKGLYAAVSSCRQLRRRFRKRTPTVLRVVGLRDLLMEQERDWRQRQQKDEKRRQLHKRRAILLRFLEVEGMERKDYLRGATWSTLQKAVLNAMALRASMI